TGPSPALRVVRRRLGVPAVGLPLLRQPRPPPPGPPARRGRGGPPPRRHLRGVPRLRHDAGDARPAIAAAAARRRRGDAAPRPRRRGARLRGAVMTRPPFDCVLVANPGSRRVALFQGALAGLGLPPACVVPWIDLLAGNVRLEDSVRPGSI